MFPWQTAPIESSIPFPGGVGPTGARSVSNGILEAGAAPGPSIGRHSINRPVFRSAEHRRDCSENAIVCSVFNRAELSTGITACDRRKINSKPASRLLDQQSIGQQQSDERLSVEARNFFGIQNMFRPFPEFVSVDRHGHRAGECAFLSRTIECNHDHMRSVALPDLAVQTSSLKFSERVTSTTVAVSPVADNPTPRSCNSTLRACSMRATSPACREEEFRTSASTFCPAGKAAAIFRARSLAESSRFEERAAPGIPSKTRRNRIERQENVDRSRAIIGMLRLAPRDINSERHERARTAENHSTAALQRRRSLGAPCAKRIGPIARGFDQPIWHLACPKNSVAGSRIW